MPRSSPFTATAHPSLRTASGASIALPLKFSILAVIVSCVVAFLYWLFTQCKQVLDEVKKQRDTLKKQLSKSETNVATIKSTPAEAATEHAARAEEFRPFLTFFTKYSPPAWYDGYFSSNRENDDYVVVALQKEKEWAATAEAFLPSFQSLSSDSRRALEEAARLEKGQLQKRASCKTLVNFWLASHRRSDEIFSRSSLQSLPVSFAGWTSLSASVHPITKNSRD